jgi:putative thioredoxin
MSDSPHAIETTAERFDSDVLERSKTTPVVLDFWAAWCQPCRRLSPLLEKAAAEAAGQFVVVKADVDQLPDRAAAFGVEGIPAVFAVRDGQVVDSFVGLLTESQLREWLARIVPSEAERLVKEAEALEATDADQARVKYEAAANLDANLPQAQIGRARVLLAQGAIADAQQVIDWLEKRGFLEPEAERLKAAIALKAGGVSADELTRLQVAAQAAPNDGRAQLKLAEALLAAGRHEEGLTRCLNIVSKNQGELRDEARRAMLDAFRVLGDEAELTRKFRRELALALY